MIKINENIICPICGELIYYRDIVRRETQCLALDILIVDRLCPTCNKSIIYYEEKNRYFSPDYGWRRGAKSIKMYCYDKIKEGYVRCNSYTFDFKNKNILYSSIREY